MTRRRSSDAKTKPPPPAPARPRRWILGALALVLLLGGGLLLADWWTCLPDGLTASYVGRQSCIQCHAQQAHDWTGSHHDLAMDRASDETVLGDFDDAQLTHFDVTSRMFRRDGKFMVHTEGPDGQLGDFEVKYVFGVTPLQQYMVEFDRPADMPDDEIARLQVLRLCWDTERRRWFYLPPPDVDEKLEPDDDLHWTGVTMRWNTSCADCHSTNLQKNFDVGSKTYHTTFSEIDVSCEACHGPGSIHEQLAHGKSLFWDRKYGYGLARLKGEDTRPQIDTCATCHSRRQRTVHPHFRPGENFYDHYANALLMPLLYHADGQILDEVYVHGSFLQSKMYHKGVRCTDCHDPHTARLKHDGNQVCTSCHEHSAGKYDSLSHHRHPAGSTGASCVECHMPATTYMEVDPRRDHSLRVPRPDLSVELRTPNACSGCHLKEAGLSDERQQQLGAYADWLVAAREGDQEVAQALDRVNQWSRDWFVRWYGQKQDLKTHFAHALAAAREGKPEAAAALIRVARDSRQAGIVRATSLYELAQFGPRQSLETSIRLLEDKDPQVRAAALGNLVGLPEDRLVQLAAPLLQDPVRLVRVEAARLLVGLPSRALRGSQQRALRAAVDELEQGLLVNNDRAGAHLMLGVLYSDLGDADGAQQAYETALRVEPRAVGPRSNLAELLERRAGELAARAARGAQADPAAANRLAELADRIGQRVAQLRREELDLLARDARLVPESAPVRYRYGLLLYLHDREAEAEAELAEACRLAPNSPDFALALALLYKKQARYAEALPLVQRIIALRPADATARQLLVELNRQAGE